MDGTAASPTSTEIIDVDETRRRLRRWWVTLGHPRVFLRIEHHEVMCPYCSRLYVYRKR